MRVCDIVDDGLQKSADVLHYLGLAFFLFCLYCFTPS